MLFGANANKLGIGDILQEAESNGVPEEPDTGEAEGRRCARDARTNRAWRTWTNAMIVEEWETCTTETGAQHIA